MRTRIAQFVIAATVVGCCVSCAPSSSTGAKSTCLSFALNVTVAGREHDLASCPGWAGVTPRPALSIKVGETIVFRAITAVRLTSDELSLVTVDGLAVKAIAPGDAVISQSGMSCAPNNSSPTSCAVVALTIK